MKRLTKAEEKLRARYPDTDVFKWHNENPKGKITADCAIRAVAAATGMSWEEVARNKFEWEIAHAEIGRGSEDMILKQYGWNKMKQPKHADGTRYTGAQFCRWLTENYPDGELGNIVVFVANHMYCVAPVAGGKGVKYKILDTWNSSSKCLNNWWVGPGVVVPVLPD